MYRKAFITYIRPLVEYNCIIWNPTHQHLIDLLESVQRKFSKRIPNLSSLSYPDRLAKLDLESLELRRLRFDLLIYHNILHSLTPLHAKDYFLIYYPPSSSRSVMPYLQQPIKATSKLSSSFFYRNIHAWNSLPCALRSVSSKTSFKTLLKKVDLTKFLKGKF